MEPDVNSKQPSTNGESGKKIAIVEKSKLEQEWESENSNDNNKNKSNDENHNPLLKKSMDSSSMDTTPSKEKLAKHQDTTSSNSFIQENDGSGGAHVSNNKRKSHYQLDPIDKSKYMFNKANNSREDSRDNIERSKALLERKKSIVSINSTESKTITLRKLW
jgi:hypothetical protein